ncbi:hypothetical protein LRS03_10550 [Rhizobacter sp. J219]|jgi:hypothetical protein|uniref:hypothetical protein n=1 Tax=Rhizobacter sp. J219 TaxID=2898430 RepID=UPI002150D64A|nr:hypothetical protein [Rhizobacter sp. J219]MCR5883268.1 hypothetical protein [Rhizobacter sp. J219]
MNTPAHASGPDDLETTLAAVETHLAALGESLRTNDSIAIDHHATELHRALARAVDHFARAARSGPVPSPLRERLKLASGLVASQRESLARATAALDRAMDVLMPRDRSSGVYSPTGSASALRGGVIQA